MSIEQNLADLTAAVNNLTAVLQSKMMAGALGSGPAVNEIAANAAAATAVKAAQFGPEHEAQLAKQKAADAKKAPKAEAAASAPPADTPATPATTDAASGDKPIDFTSQVQKPIVAMAAGGPEGRKKALAILAEFGVARASEIKPEDYAKALELIAKAG